MKKLGLLFCGIFSYAVLFGQNPATTIVLANKNINLPCGTSCTSISAQVPHLKQTDDYVLTRPAYVPFAYTSATATELTSTYTDDVFSSLITMPFNFCFYGNSYGSVVIGSNNIMTFDRFNIRFLPGCSRTDHFITRRFANDPGFFKRHPLRTIGLLK